MDRLFSSLSETIEDWRPQFRIPNLSYFGGRVVSFVGTRLKRTRRRHARDGLPLLLQSPWHPSITGDQTAEIQKVMQALRDFSAELLTFLHYVCKHLSFWRVQNESSDAAKVRFMMLERGPWAFVLGVTRIMRASIWEESVTEGIVSAVSIRITERVAVLTAVQCRVATLLGVVHMEVDKLGRELTKGNNVRPALSASLLAVVKAMSVLEGSYDLPQTDSNSFENTKATSSISLQFDEVPQDLLRKAEWTGKDVDVGIELLFSNLELLRFMIDCLMLHHQRPSSTTRHWIHYSGGAVVIALVSAWVIRHSRLGGSDDLDRWLKNGNAVVVSFTKQHVEQPLVAIRDELFTTFRKQHNQADVLSEAKLTAETLQRMLLSYVKQTGREVDENISQQEMMEVMMARYEEEVIHPLKNLVGGELARGLLVQVQKLKLDIEWGKVELNKILRANEINFAMLAAFPAVVVTILVGLIIQSVLISEDKRIGREAQAMRRMLMAEVEKAIMCFQMMVDEGQEDEASWRFGMVIFALDKLYTSVEQAARATQEWPSMRGDILDLATPRLPTSYKLAITARMERVYECLIPLPRFK